jgi:beta-lactamase regulating signal transducer with metallopeptidase domain/Skp family chaperone for outer membrane proteins
MAEQPIVAFAVVLVAQCTIVTGLALLLTALRCGAAYRAIVLQIGMYCALLCPFITTGLIASDIHWITISVGESNPPSSPANVPIEGGNTPKPEFHLPSQSPPQPIADVVRTRSVEPESKAAPTPSSERSLVARDAPQESTSDSGHVPAWTLWAVLLWAAGFVVGIIGISRSSVKVGRILHNARPVDDERLQAALAQVASTFSLSKPLRVVESSHVNSPVAAGILRTAIVLPRGLLDRVSRDELRAILLHEGAHVIRGDHLTLWLERLLAAGFWFHPLVHLLNRRLDRAREEVCDNYVLQSVDAASYGEALLRLMQLSTDGPQTGLAVGLFPARWRLDDRISALLNEGRNTMVTTRKTSKAFVAGALTLCALVVGTARVTAQPDETPSDRDLKRAKSAEPTPRTAEAEPFEIPAEAPTDEAGFSPNHRTQDRPAKTDFDEVDIEPSAEPAPRNQGIRNFDEAGFATGTTLARTPHRHARIASVDMGRLIRSSTKFQRRMKALKQKIADADGTMQNLLDEQESLQVALNAIPRDNEKARTALQKVIARNKLEIEKSRKTAQSSANKEELKKIYQDIYREAQDAIRMYADYYKIDLVFQMQRRSTSSTSPYATAEHRDDGTEDSTQDILQQLNSPIVYAPGLDQNAGNIDDITDAILDYLNKRDQRGKKFDEVDRNTTE